MDQNHRSPSKKPGPYNLRTKKARISALVWDLRSFDVTTIRRPTDPKVKALAARINTTLSGIFGRGSREYKDCSMRSLHKPPRNLNSAYPLSELRRGYQRGIDTAIRKLGLLLDSIDRQMRAAREVAPPARRAGAAAQRSPHEGKVSLVTMRGKLKSMPPPPRGLDASPSGDGTRVRRKPAFGVTVGGGGGGGVIDLVIEIPRPKEGTTKARIRVNLTVPARNDKKKALPGTAKAARRGKKGKDGSPIAGKPDTLTLHYMEAMRRARQTERPERGESAQREPKASARPTRRTARGQARREDPCPARRRHDPHRR